MAKEEFCHGLKKVKSHQTMHLLTEHLVQFWGQYNHTMIACLGPLPTRSFHIKRLAPLTPVATPRVGSKFKRTTKNQIGNPNRDFKK